MALRLDSLILRGFHLPMEARTAIPFPPTKVYDEVIDFMNKNVTRAKIDHTDKQKAFKKLHQIAKTAEKAFIPDESKYEDWIDEEWKNSSKYGGRTVFDGKDKSHPTKKKNGDQLSLFN
jgi:hypothetical protein